MLGLNLVDDVVASLAFQVADDTPSLIIWSRFGLRALQVATHD